MNNLILIGFKGAGKTTLGRKLSTVLQKPFIDTDDLFGEPPAELYKKVGAAAFRACEKQILQSLAHFRGHVIATGGGIILDPDNQHLLRTLGTVIHLHTPKEIIAGRIGDHPFLKEYDNRLGIYKKIAHHSISSEDEIWEVIRSDPFSV